MKNDVVFIQKAIKPFLFGLSPLNTKQINCKKRGSFASTKLYKILGTNLKGIGISWKRNLPKYGYTRYLARLQEIWENQPLLYSQQVNTDPFATENFCVFVCMERVPSSWLFLINTHMFIDSLRHFKWLIRKCSAVGIFIAQTKWLTCRK